VPFQSAEILARVSLAAPKNVSPTDVHIPIIDGISTIVTRLFAKQNAALADYAVGHVFVILDHLLNLEDEHFTKLLRHVFEKLEIISPLAVLNERLVGGIPMPHPLGKVYGLNNPQSLGYLFSKSTKLNKVDVDRPWVNPYSDFLEIADLYSRHFRRLAEKIDFANSFLLWELNELIKYVVSSLAELVEHPLRPEYTDEIELIDKLKRILSFYWVAFHEKKVVHQQHADDACETLAYAGLLFFQLGYPDVVKSCVSYMRSIIESYCEVMRPIDDYALGDFFAHLWSLRLLVTARRNVPLTEIIDDALNAKPKALSDDDWQQAQEAIELRRRQLETRIEESDRMRDPGSSEVLLTRLLQVNTETI
jgi:hypothetical protein